MAKKEDSLNVIILGPHTRVEGTLKVPSAARFQEFIAHNEDYLPVHDAEFIEVESKELIHSAKLAYVNLREFLAVIPKHAAKLKKAAEASPSGQTLDKLMTRKLLTVRESDTLHKAFQLMKEKDIHHLPVMKGNTMVGLISKSDVRMHLFNQHDEPVRKFMQKKVVVASAQDTLSDAIRNMAHHKVTCFPILTNKKLVGIVTMRDLLRVLAERS